jgi:hypothetical protein
MSSSRHHLAHHGQQVGRLHGLDDPAGGPALRASWRRSIADSVVSIRIGVNR